MSEEGTSLKINSTKPGRISGSFETVREDFETVKICLGTFSRSRTLFHHYSTTRSFLETIGANLCLLDCFHFCIHSIYEKASDFI